MKLSVVSPVYRAAPCVRELHRRLTAVLTDLGVDYEIILVEDGGGDGSDAIIEEIAAADARVRGILLSRNFGQHSAITAGLAAAQGDWVVVMDCDLQDPPEGIPALLARAKEGFDVVFARRVARKHSPLKHLMSRLWHEAIFYLSGARADPSVGSFSIISRQVVQEFLRVVDAHRHYLLILRWLGFRQGYVDIEHAPRLSGRSSYNLPRLIAHSIAGIASQSVKLLHFSIYLGFAFVAVAIAQIVWLFYRKFFHNIGVEGWASLMVVLWLIGGTILFCLGVLGIYIGKIFEQAKQRPLYIVRKDISARSDELGETRPHLLSGF